MLVGRGLRRPAGESGLVRVLDEAASAGFTAIDLGLGPVGYFPDGFRLQPSRTNSHVGDCHYSAGGLFDPLTEAGAFSARDRKRLRRVFAKFCERSARRGPSSLLIASPKRVAGSQVVAPDIAPRLRPGQTGKRDERAGLPRSPESPVTHYGVQSTDCTLTPAGLRSNSKTNSTAPWRISPEDLRGLCIDTGHAAWTCRRRRSRRTHPPPRRADRA